MEQLFHTAIWHSHSGRCVPYTVFSLQMPACFIVGYTRGAQHFNQNKTKKDFRVFAFILIFTSHPLFHSILPPSFLLPDLFSLLKFYTFLSSIFIPIPQRLSIFTRVAVISSWHHFNPSSAYQAFPPFLILLYIAPLFHLDLHVSVGLSILLRPGSKLKWF